MFYLNTNETFSKDRFNIRRFVEYKDNLFDFINSQFLIELNKLSVFGQKQVVAEESRPDLLSYNIYGTTDLWWILLYYNNLVSPTDLKYGMIIKYPSLEDVELLIHKLKLRSRK